MNLTQPLHKAARERPDGTMSVFAGRRRSNAESVDRVARLAGALRGLGVGPGDRVAMLALNSDRYLEYIFATLWAGGVINPVNVRWTPDEIAFSLDDCDTRVLIVDETFAGMVGAIGAASRSLATVIGLDAPGIGDHDFEALVAGADPTEDAWRGGDDLAAILYTGGTTGRPKGVMLSHANLYLNALSLTAAATHGGDAPGLHVAPMFHIGGVATCFQFAMRRAPQVFAPAFDPGDALRIIEAERIGDIFLVPTMLRRLVDHPDRPKRDASSLRSIRYGAAPIDGALLDAAMAAFPNAGFMQVYGQTECAPVVTVLSPEDHARDGNEARLRSAGRPLPTAEVRILDPDGKELPTGRVGEIAVRGPTVMQGYWNRPEETAAALRDGWMHSGDAGFMDEAGYLHIADRVKDMIITGGENVYSTEVEDALARLPGVAACAVIGVPDEEWGERVHAVVVPAPGGALSEEDLKAGCKARIAAYKCPRSFAFVDVLPLSPAGKVLKHVLREPWWKDKARRVG